MASKSSDHTRSNSVRRSKSACVRMSSSHEKSHEDDIQPHEEYGPDCSPPNPSLPETPLSLEETGRVEDEELLEMLEQLSKTIDSANDAIAGQKALSSSDLYSENTSTPEASAAVAGTSEEQVSGMEFPFPPHVEPPRRRVFVRALATAFSLFFGIAALAAIWLLWNSPVWNGQIDLAKNQDRIPPAIISRTYEADNTSRVLTSSPAKTAPLRSTLIVVAKPLTVSEPAIKPEPPALGKEEERRFLARGRELISTGDVASARLAFKYAAHRGSSDAMFALAQTYDADMLATWNVVGIEPDAIIALEWYGLAAQKGLDPADARANELDQQSSQRGRQ